MKEYDDYYGGKFISGGYITCDGEKINVDNSCREMLTPISITRQRQKIKVAKNDFDQSEYWVSANGSMSTVEGLTNSHLLNIVLFLLRNANKLKSAYDVALADSVMELPSEIVADLSHIWNIEPYEWLTETKLYGALYMEIVDRNLLELFHIMLDREDKDKK